MQVLQAVDGADLPILLASLLLAGRSDFLRDNLMVDHALGLEEAEFAFIYVYWRWPSRHDLRARPSRRGSDGLVARALPGLLAIIEVVHS